VPLIATNFVEMESPNYRKTFLFFGGNGAVHKGLHMVINVFKNKSDCVLHVVGDYNSFLSKLNRSFPGNIFFHGHLDINDLRFSNILSRCAYIILPSASEALPSSVVTAVCMKPLIPIVSKFCDFNDDDALFIDLNESSIRDCIDMVCNMSDSDYWKLSNTLHYKYRVHHRRSLFVRQIHKLMSNNYV